jgi:hypothetical protein
MRGGNGTFDRGGSGRDLKSCPDVLSSSAISLLQIYFHIIFYRLQSNATDRRAEAIPTLNL